MPTSQLTVQQLESIALEGGATAVKQIAPQDVIVAQWVRNKCQFGCPHFASVLPVLPTPPPPEETAATLQSYQKALLVQFADMQREQLRVEPGRSMIHNVIYGMERNAFLSGYERAFSYEAGPCALCRECPAEKLGAPNLFCKKECKRPKEARPAMEAAGIDVYSTVRRAGFELHVVRERAQPFSFFGLVLLE